MSINSMGNNPESAGEREATGAAENASEITSEQLAEKVSLLLVKPEMVGREVLFPAILRNHGLQTERHEIVLTKEIIDGLYPDISTWKEGVATATYNHLLNKPAVIFLISASGQGAPHSNILEEVLSIRGDKTDPLKCSPASLRHVFRGPSYTVDQGDDSFVYSENGVHCPRNASELITNLSALNLKTQAEELFRQSP